MAGLLWVLLSLNFSMLGDVLLKCGGSRGLIFGLLSYTCAAYPAWKAYQSTSFTSVTVIWQAVFLVESLTIGFLLFGDTMTVRKGIGIGLALVAIILVGGD